ncbi:MAG: LCP family protein [Clostridia bacterium]|nr:LCP family protein [Clostridia bacterium]
MSKDEWSAGGKSRTIRKSKKGDQGEFADSEKVRPTVGKSKAKGRTFLIVLLTVLLLGAMYMGFQYTDRLLAVDEGTLLDNKTKTDQVNPGGLKKRDVLSILIIGTDQRGGEAARSDTTILAIFDKKEKKVHFFSIPRDTRADIPGRGAEKLTHAYAYGKGELTKQTVEKLLDIKIDGFISTNFAGFAKIVDIIGGIELDVEVRMYYPDEDIDLFPGVQKMDGADSLAYVRYRSNAQGDIGRMERQQKFMKVLAEHLLNVTNILKIPNLVREFNSNVKTDMNVKDMAVVGNLLRNVKIENLSSQTLPGEPVWINKISYWQLDKAKVKNMLDEILYEQPKEKVE